MKDKVISIIRWGLAIFMAVLGLTIGGIVLEFDRNNNTVYEQRGYYRGKSECLEKGMMPMAIPEYPTPPPQSVWNE